MIQKLLKMKIRNFEAFFKSQKRKMKREKLKLTHYVALTVTFAAVYKMWNMFSSDFFDELDGQSFKGN